MVEVVKNPFYSIRVDRDKNRAYIKLFGVWDDQPEIIEFLEYVKEYLLLVKPGFCVVSDIRELEECSLLGQEIHLQAHNLNIEAGIHQLAEIHTLNEPISDLSIYLAHESHISLNIFENDEDANAWLDDLAK